MNRFLTPLTNAILARKGAIDNTWPTPPMAFWNAPLADKEHQLDAGEAAIDMLERIGAQEGAGSRRRKGIGSTSRSMSASA